jgi:hypothetical protein
MLMKDLKLCDCHDACVQHANAQRVCAQCLMKRPTAQHSLENVKAVELIVECNAGVACLLAYRHRLSETCCRPSSNSRFQVAGAPDCLLSEPRVIAGRHSSSEGRQITPLTKQQSAGLWHSACMLKSVCTASVHDCCTQSAPSHGYIAWLTPHAGPLVNELKEP